MPQTRRMPYTTPGQEEHYADVYFISTLTPEGRQTLHRNPERLEEVNREITEFGCKVVAQYAVLGPYDFVSIIEADDNETIAHLSVDLGSRGPCTLRPYRPWRWPSCRRNLKGRARWGDPNQRDPCVRTLEGMQRLNQATQHGTLATRASEQYKRPRVVKCMNLMWTDLEEQKEGGYQP